MAPRSPAMSVHKRLGAALFALALVALFVLPAPLRAAEFVDAAGRRVILPDSIGHVMPASQSAEVLVFALASDRLAGLSRPLRRGTKAARSRPLPVLDWRAGPDSAAMVETARRLHPDVIVDSAVVTPGRAAFAEEVQQQTGIPYILTDESFARIPAVIRAIGEILKVGDRAKDLGLYAEHAVAALRGRLLIRAPDARPRVYYGRGADGLETPLPGSASGEAIDEAGAINVAAPLGRGGRAIVTREQLLAWDPEIIIAEQRSFYDALRRSPGWRGLAAVRQKRVYLAPADPYGWIDDPPGINRLIGLYWLSSLFYPDATEEDLRAVTCGFYDKFYGIKLTNGRLEALVGPAGAPPPDQAGIAGEPLVGLGAAPLSALPGTPTGAPPTGTPMTGMPTVPLAKPAPNEPCTLPGAMPSLGIPPETTSPGAIPQPQAPAPGAAPGAAPGVPPPGRRGVAPGLTRPGAPPQ